MNILITTATAFLASTRRSVSWRAVRKKAEEECDPEGTLTKLSPEPLFPFYACRFSCCTTLTECFEKANLYITCIQQVIKQSTIITTIMKKKCPSQLQVRLLWEFTQMIKFKWTTIHLCRQMSPSTSLTFFRVKGRVKWTRWIQDIWQ